MTPLYDPSSVGPSEQAAVAACIVALKDTDHSRPFDIALEEERLRRALHDMGRDDSYIKDVVRYAHSQ